MLATISVNPALILYSLGIFAWLTKALALRFNRKMLFLSKVILFLSIIFVFCYSYSKINLDIGQDFLAGVSTESGAEFYNNRYTSPMIYYILLISLTTILFSKKNFVYYFYLSAAIGAISANTLLTAFTYLEIMSIFAIITILRDTKNKNIGMAYVIIHCISGVLMLVGVVGYTLNTDIASIAAERSVSFSHISWSWKVPALLFLIGMLMNLGLPPFSYLITECYTVIDGFSAVILSTVSTKIYLLFFINTFFGVEFLWAIGLIMIIYSGICAILNRDLRRIINHWLILHLGIVIAFCSLDYNFDHGRLGFVVLMNMISVFSVSTCIGLLYSISPEYVRNINNLGHKSIHYIQKSIILFILIINISGLPLAADFFSNAVLHSNDNRLNIMHYIVGLLCNIIAARLVYCAFFGKPDREVFEREKAIKAWASPLILSIFSILVITSNIQYITEIYFSKTIHIQIDFLFYIINFVAISLTMFISSRFNIRTYHKFGLDLVWIYEKVSIPTVTIFRVFILTILDLFSSFYYSIADILKKHSYIVENKKLNKLLFYNSEQQSSLLNLIILLLVCLVFLII